MVFMLCSPPNRLLLLAVAVLTDHSHSLFGLRKSHLPVVGEVLEQCWTRWARAAEVSRQREKDEQSLYKYRQKTHVIEEEEGEVLEEELKRVFPVYEFMEGEGERSCDLARGSEGEGKGHDEPKTDNSAPLEFSLEELQSIASLHMSLHHRGGSVSTGSRSIKSAKLSYDLAGSMARSLDAIPGMQAILHIPCFHPMGYAMFDILGLGFDQSLLASHVNMCVTALESLNSSTEGR